MAFEQLMLVPIFIWLLVLSLVVYRFYRSINSLVKESKGESLIKTLGAIIAKEKKNSSSLNSLERDLAGVKLDSLSHVQKVGLVRFNPFNETGGDHSFSMSVLDANDTGFVITGLHTRERTRLYVKSVSRGKSEYELSKEEKEAIIKAQK